MRLWELLWSHVIYSLSLGPYLIQVGSLLRDRTLETSHPLENQPFPLSLWSFSKSSPFHDPLSLWSSSPSQDPMYLWSEFSYSSSIVLGPAGNCWFNRWQKCRFWVIFSFAGRNRWFTRFPLWQIWSFPEVMTSFGWRSWFFGLFLPIHCFHVQHYIKYHVRYSKSPVTWSNGCLIHPSHS